MRREPLPAEVRLGEPAVLQQHTPGAVEHEDALLGEFLISVATSLGTLAFLLPKGCGASKLARAL